jgi:hypothetical protein
MKSRHLPCCRDQCNNCAHRRLRLLALKARVHLESTSMPRFFRSKRIQQNLLQALEHARTLRIHWQHRREQPLGSLTSYCICRRSDVSSHLLRCIQLSQAPLRPKRQQHWVTRGRRRKRRNGARTCGEREEEGVIYSDGVTESLRGLGEGMHQGQRRLQQSWGRERVEVLEG